MTSWVGWFVLYHVLGGRVISAMSPTTPDSPGSCPQPTSILNGSVKLRAIPESQTLEAIYSCSKGYMLLGKGTMICNNDGTWIGSPPTCSKGGQYCQDPGDSIINGQRITTPFSKVTGQFPTGTKLMYTCRPFYTMKGSSMIVCTDDNTWQPAKLPTCHRYECYVPFIRNGQVIPQQGGYFSGDRTSVICKAGYNANVDDPVLTCMDSGHWLTQMGSYTLPQCVHTSSCSTPPNIENGDWVFVGMMPSSVTYQPGTTIRYHCADNYVLKGSRDLQCLLHVNSKSTYWSHAAPTCVSRCLFNWDSISTAHRHCQPSRLCNQLYVRVGDLVRYYCDTDYEPNGPTTLTCGQSGWSGNPPTCNYEPIAMVTTEATQLAKADNSGGTLTVLLIISGSILGALTIVILIVVFHKRRSGPRTSYRVIATPPPTYNRSSAESSNESLNEHDRVALIAFADGAQVVLPTYEEATRNKRTTLGRDQRILRAAQTDYVPLSRQTNHFRPSGSTSEHSVSSRASSPLSGSMRGEAGSLRADSGSMRADTPSIHPPSDRISLMTNTSSHRDNGSEMFGSGQTIDQVNISDGTSTTVTIDTYTSSNASLAASRRAAAGSIESSDSLDTEDAPLIESSCNTHRPPTPKNSESTNITEDIDT